MDKYNTPILKKYPKIHRITFRDHIYPAKKLVDVIEVENWKALNIQNDDEATTACSCRLL
jgi:hypothetical protein